MAVVAQPNGKVMMVIADFYSGQVRAVGPDGIIREVSDEGREAFGAPTRVAFSPLIKGGGWLLVADSSQDRIVPFSSRRCCPT